MSRLAYSLLSFLLLSAAARAGADEAPLVVFPAIPAQAQTQADLVPKGWTVEMESRGDLNGDRVPDLLLVLHMTDPSNVIKNDGFGASELDTNPRILVIAFAGKATKKYSLALANHTLIPRHTNPSMDDPLAGAEIVKGTLQVSLGFWMSAGSWYESQTRFTFRYQDGCFKLIGYDSTGRQRNSEETSTVSINYLTRKAKTTKGNIQNDRTSVAWKTVRTPALLCLDAVGDGLDFDPES
ncbi:MAG: hypothetical protein ACJ76J_02430 [Thermoanaerobaculia bacterium]